MVIDVGFARSGDTSLVFGSQAWGIAGSTPSQVSGHHAKASPYNAGLKDGIGHDVLFILDHRRDLSIQHAK